jgi:hypothetical protein
VERTLGLICGAGVLPARMAAHARRQGWRVVAFAFGDAPGLAESAHATIASRISDLGPVLAGLAHHGVSAALLSGKFRLADVFATEAPDAAHARLAARAGQLVDTNLSAVAAATLDAMGIALLDQRPFLGDGIGGPGCWSAREPTGSEWDDVRRGLDAARTLADARIGQTVVVRRGAVSAVEAMEGTTETIRRGTALGGPGAVVVKATARAHDYRFDTPSIGPETIDVAAEGGAAVVAIEADRVFIVDRAATVRRADAAGIALVSVSAPP